MYKKKLRFTRTAWRLWNWSCRRDMSRFEHALKNPRHAQEEHLKSILAHAEDTIWAKQYGIHAHSTLQDFRNRVPVMGPSVLGHWTQKIIKGNIRVLTNEKIERLVPTSGTTGTPKLIPMTPSSRREFSTGVNLWIGDSIRNHPSIMQGRCYIATSPSMDVEQRKSAVPIEFAEDRAYLGRIEEKILNPLLVTPPQSAKLRGSAWRDFTRQCLMESEDIRFLSLWHPSYLEAIFNDDELAKLADTWDQLALISCWADGACSAPAKQLLKHFPKARHIPKGLWLTEGVISVSWHSFHPIALLCGFIEFEGNDGELLLAHELAIDAIYRPVLTNHAGLYRYRLGDLIQVTDFIHQTPSIRWVGRADKVSDVCGEKLSETEVSQAIKKIEWKDFCALVPQRTTKKSYYVCLIPQNTKVPFPQKSLEAEFEKNPHYRWARITGQLAPLRVKKINTTSIRHKKDPLHVKGSYLYTQTDDTNISELIESNP